MVIAETKWQMHETLEMKEEEIAQLRSRIQQVAAQRDQLQEQKEKSEKAGNLSTQKHCLNIPHYPLLHQMMWFLVATILLLLTQKYEVWINRLKMITLNGFRNTECFSLTLRAVSYRHLLDSPRSCSTDKLGPPLKVFWAGKIDVLAELGFDL